MAQRQAVGEAVGQAVGWKVAWTRQGKLQVGGEKGNLMFYDV